VNLACDNTSTSSGNAQTMTLTEDFGDGPLTLTRSSVIPPTGAITTTFDVTRAGVALLRETFTGFDANGAETAEVSFGAGFHGPTNFSLSTTGGLVSGTIDGKAVRPFDPNTTDPSTVVLADGSPLPTLTADDGIVEQVRALMKADGVSTSQCGPGNLSLLRDLPTGAPAPPPIVVEGHTTFTGDLKSCSDCRGVCNNTYFGCAGTAAATCGGVGALFSETIVGFFVGIGCGAVLEYSCEKIQESCLASCDDPGAGCCPQACGKNGCCAASGIEFCLDPKQALCCDSEFTACPGSEPSCYDPTQAYCLPSGRACKNGVGSCGTGQGAFCCDGTCVNGTCTLGPTFGISVGITQGDLGDLAFCLSGQGFTPLGAVSIDIGPVPGTTGSGPQPGFVLTQTAADGNGTFSTVVHQSVSQVLCEEPINPGEVTLTGNDLTTKTSTTTTFPGGYYCNNVLSATNFGAGCSQ
jgi:hypothetical protein